MLKRSCFPIALIVFALFAPGLLQSYIPLRPDAPARDPSVIMYAEHDANDVLLGLMSSGQIGYDLISHEPTGIWPIDSGNSYIWLSGLLIGGIADLDGDGESDTSGLEACYVFSGASEFAPGRVTDDPEDPLARLFVSTNPGDLEEWPPEFRDEQGEPVVYSLQDIVGIYNSTNGSPQTGINADIEIEQRSMSFTVRRTSQIIIFVWDMTNVSAFSENGPYTLEDAYIGMNADLDIGINYNDDRASRFTYHVTDQGDSTPVHMMYAWDQNFFEEDFQGTPGFIGLKFLLTPGNDQDGIDNDSDGIVDESPYNSLDDDGDGQVDEWDETDELGLRNYSYHCHPSVCDIRPTPQTDPELYRVMACSPPGECVETAEASDIRLMMSSGPFDWPPGRTIRVAAAYVFANPFGEPHPIQSYGDPPRPDPNDPIFADFLAVALDAQSFFDSGFSDSAGYLHIYETTRVDITNKRHEPYEIGTFVIGTEGIAQVTVFSSSDGGASYTLSSMERAGDYEFTGTIPAPENWWAEIGYFIQAVDSSFQVLRDPPDAPEHVYEFAVVPSPDFFPPDSVTGVDLRSYDLLSWLDYDKNGDLDIYARYNYETYLFQNERGRRFEDVTGESGTNLSSVHSAVSGDYNNDTFDDILFSGYNRPLTVLRNMGDGTFTNVSQEIGLEDTLRISGVAWCDVDLDGYLDIIATDVDWGNHLYMNRMGEFFFDEGTRRGLDVENIEVTGALLFDADADGDQDFLSTYPPTHFLENVGGFFQDRTAESGLGSAASFAISLDIDSDRDMDILTEVSSAFRIFINDGSGVFTLEERDRGLPFDIGFVPILDDANADGSQDLMMPLWYGSYFLLNPEGNFLNATGLLDDPHSFLPTGLADVNNDGRLDVFGGEGMYLSAGIPGEYENNYLEVDLEGRSSNRSGIGASVTLFAGGKVLTQQVTGQSPGPRRLFFGIEQENPDSIAIHWPGGSTQVARGLPVNALITVVEDSTFIGIEGEESGDLPVSYALYQNYPNPFNPSTQIAFDIPGEANTKSRVTLTIFDVRGRRVRMLLDAELQPGNHRVAWDGKDGKGRQASSGIYLYTLRCGKTVSTRKMTILR